MLTYENLGKYGRFGNQLFQIASVIGIAKQRNEEFGFPEWEYKRFFVNDLPQLEGRGISLTGYLQDYRNFDHCRDLIIYYFEMKELTKKLKNSVFIHYRDYEAEGMTGCHPVQTKEYYKEAKRYFKGKTFVLFSDNIEKAREVVDCEFFFKGDEMTAFYLMRHCEGGIIANSSFSWWAGYLSGGRVVAPLEWFAGRKAGNDTTGYYLPNWIKI